MIAHTNRGRLSVDVGGKWRLYTNTIPAGAEAIGVVSRGELGDMGALVKLANGNYVQINAGVIRRLDGRKIAAALGGAGRPAELENGKRVNVYLDADSLSIAAEVGNGNVSEGIRRALKAADSSGK